MRKDPDRITHRPSFSLEEQLPEQDIFSIQLSKTLLKEHKLRRSNCASKLTETLHALRREICENSQGERSRVNEITTKLYLSNFSVYLHEGARQLLTVLKTKWQGSEDSEHSEAIRQMTKKKLRAILGKVEVEVKIPSDVWGSTMTDVLKTPQKQALVQYISTLLEVCEEETSSQTLVKFKSLLEKEGEISIRRRTIIWFLVLTQKQFGEKRNRSE